MKALRHTIVFEQGFHCGQIQNAVYKNGECLCSFSEELQFQKYRYTQISTIQYDVCKKFVIFFQILVVLTGFVHTELHPYRQHFSKLEQERSLEQVCVQPMGKHSGIFARKTATTLFSDVDSELHYLTRISQILLPTQEVPYVAVSIIDVLIGFDIDRMGKENWFFLKRILPLEMANPGGAVSGHSPRLKSPGRPTWEPEQKRWDIAKNFCIAKDIAKNIAKDKRLHLVESKKPLTSRTTNTQWGLPIEQTAFTAATLAAKTPSASEYLPTRRLFQWTWARARIWFACEIIAGIRVFFSKINILFVSGPNSAPGGLYSEKPQYSTYTVERSCMAVQCRRLASKCKCHSKQGTTRPKRSIC